MGRAGITYTEVAEAAKELVESGITPTIEKIRAITGIGSYTTIGALLKKWKETVSTEPLATAQGIPSALLVTIKNLWERLTAEAQQTCGALQAVIAQHIQTEQALRHEIEELTTTHQQEKQMLHSQLEHFTVQHREQQSQLATTTQQLKEQSLLIDNLHEQINSKKNDNEKLHALTQQLHQNLEHFQSMTAKQRQEEQLTFHEQKSQLTHQIKMLSEQLHQSQHMANEQTQQNRQLTEQLNSAQQQLHTLQSDIPPLKTMQKTLQKQIADLNCEKSSLLALLDREKKEVLTLQERCDTWLQSTMQLQIENKQLKQKKSSKTNKTARKAPA